MAAAGPGPTRRPRADAAANRERILASARHAFGRSGVEAPLDRIAVGAGVGNATLYRHFPTRDELVVAVYAERLTVVRDFLAEREGRPDPGRTFADYVRHLAATPDLALLDVLAMPPEQTPEVAGLRREIRVLVAALIGRAQDAGSLRRDLDLEDLNVFLYGYAYAAADDRLDPARRARLVEHYLAGLAAT